MVDRVEEGKLDQVVMIAWALWCNRNEVRNGGKQKTGSELIRWAATYLAEYTTATVSPSKPTPPRLELRSLWTPPLALMFKVNVDGAVFSALGAVGIGIIIQDEEGRVVAALSKRIIKESALTLNRKWTLYCKDWNELINYIQALFLYLYTETNGKFNRKYQVTNSLK